MTPQEQEIERIGTLAFVTLNPQDMLACILLRLDSGYIYRDPSNRKATGELLTADLKPRAQQLHRIVGSSDLHDAVKQTVTGAVEFFLRRIGVGATEMAEFKATCQFDPFEFDLFAGLGPDGD